MSLADMTRDELRELIAETVRETLTQMGADPAHPLEMQRDFQHLRQWRRAAIGGGPGRTFTTRK